VNRRVGRIKTDRPNLPAVSCPKVFLNVDSQPRRESYPGAHTTRALRAQSKSELLYALSGDCRGFRMILRTLGNRLFQLHMDANPNLSPRSDTSASVRDETFCRQGDSNGMSTARYTNVEGLSVIHMQLPASGRRVLAATLAAIVLSSAAHFTPARAQSDADSGDRAVSPRVSLPLQVGFFNGATALYITPEVGVDPNAPAATIAAAKQIAEGFNANFIAQNFGVLPDSTAVNDIFVFTNFTQATC
jgi:hypothetical protein